MLELKSKIGRMARANGCVLVRGESGTGKELVARAVHQASPRADRPMLCVNCAAIPPDLMESQLFGHKAGSFTGADRDHIGFFQQADMGTLFLDEVGEMTLEGQAKLLRILEGHPFLPVGSSERSQVDVRVIAATNQDLQTYVREQEVSRGLVLSLEPCSSCQCRRCASGARTSICWSTFFSITFAASTAGPTLRLSTDAREKLLAYHWPGNVRQLRNVIDSAVVLAEGQRDRSLATWACTKPAGGELETLKLEVLGAPADQRGPATHRRQRARSRQAAGHRPGHAVS